MGCCGRRTCWASGLRIWTQARAAFVGLTAGHTRAHLVRAVLEGVAYSLKDTFTLFAELGIPVKGVRLGGGGARGPLWREIQAAVYGHTADVLVAEEGGAFGAALLAGCRRGCLARSRGRLRCGDRGCTAD